MVSLVYAPLGKEVTVLKYICSDDKVKRHLENLGILSGAKIMPVFTSGGDVIIRLHGAKLAINKAIAMKIFVSVA